MIDVDALLREVAADAPCGPNLEYDPDFLSLEQEAQGKPEVQYGDTITQAVDPDWKAVRRMAHSLLERSRDLRLAIHLLRAELALSGIAGMAEGIHLIERLLDERWDSVHPELDPDDNLDPTLRINSLAFLADTGSLVRAVKEAVILTLPGLGPLNVRMLELATGETAAPEGHNTVSIASIEQAMADLPAEQRAAAATAIARALNAVVNIETLLVRKVGSSQALNLDGLTRPLRRAHEFLARQLQEAAEAVQDEAGEGAEQGALPAGGAAVAGRAISGEIASRDDVVRMLDKLLQYYRKQEPSSPVPILLERAKRIVPMNFFEVMQELAPDGIAQLAVIRGAAGSEQ